MDIERMVNEVDLGTFEKKYRDAKGFHHRAKQFLEEGQCYSVIFNVAAVAIENYLVALCELYGVMPGNHNYTYLMDEIETIIDVPVLLNKEIRSLDFIFGICSIENYHHGDPEISDSDRVLSMCNEINKLFDPDKISCVRAASQDNGAD
jgi:hypothetical protein